LSAVAHRYLARGRELTRNLRKCRTHNVSPEHLRDADETFDQGGGSRAEANERLLQLVRVLSTPLDLALTRELFELTEAAAPEAPHSGHAPSPE